MGRSLRWTAVGLMCCLATPVTAEFFKLGRTLHLARRAGSVPLMIWTRTENPAEAEAALQNVPGVLPASVRTVATSRTGTTLAATATEEGLLALVEHRELWAVRERIGRVCRPTARPVCARDEDGNIKLYSNACEADADYATDIGTVSCP
jgi:hypothetical protein